MRKRSRVDSSKLVAADVHAIGPVSESVGSGNQDEIGMALRLRIRGSVRNRKVSVGQRLIDDQQHVGVSGVDFVQQEHPALFVELHELRPLIFEPSAVPGRNQAAQ